MQHNMQFSLSLQPPSLQSPLLLRAAVLQRQSTAMMRDSERINGDINRPLTSPVRARSSVRPPAKRPSKQGPATARQQASSIINSCKPVGSPRRPASNLIRHSPGGQRVAANQTTAISSRHVKPKTLTSPQKTSNDSLAIRRSMWKLGGVQAIPPIGQESSNSCAEDGFWEAFSRPWAVQPLCAGSIGCWSTLPGQVPRSSGMGFSFELSTCLVGVATTSPALNQYSTVLASLPWPWPWPWTVI
ncbi:hypothetical protein J3F83DRAFT_639810 [Trichoderma novae-zelandiae]